MEKDEFVEKIKNMNRDIGDLICKNLHDYDKKNYSLSDVVNDVHKQLKCKYIDLKKSDVIRFLMVHLGGWIEFY